MEILARLEETRERTLRCFDFSEEALELRYAADKWTVRFLLHHLADAEMVFFDRIRRVISEERRQVLWAFDPAAAAIALDWEHMPLALSRGIYDSVRAGVIYQDRLHYERRGDREFVHSEAGIRTLKDEFDKVGWHNQHHLDQIQKALDGRQRGGS